VEAGGVTFRCLRGGTPLGAASRTPILFLHGYPAWAEVWLPLAAVLGAGHPWIAPDLPCHNRSSPLPGKDRSLSAYRRAVVALLDALALPKVIVRDPIRRTLEHVDLVAVRRGEKVTVDVPLTLTGATTSDVLVDQQRNTLSVEAEATHLPTGFEISIEGLKAGQTVRVEGTCRGHVPTLAAVELTDCKLVKDK